MPTIKARLVKARRVLKVYRENHPGYKNNPKEPDCLALRDMIADCLHLADQKNWEPLEMLEVAKYHFLVERGT